MSYSVDQIKNDVGFINIQRNLLIAYILYSTKELYTDNMVTKAAYKGLLHYKYPY